MEPSAGMRWRCSTVADWVSPSCGMGMRVPGGKGGRVREWDHFAVVFDVAI